jgi:formate-dependent nitrite reductase cytochrome c552 subunit
MSKMKGTKRMVKRWMWTGEKSLAVIVFLLAVLIVAQGAKPAATPVRIAAPAEARVDPKTCFECHAEVAGLWEQGKHKAALNCINCHSGLGAHLSEGARPVTILDPGRCGACHKQQYESFNRVNLHKRARVEKSLLTERSPNPLWDKLMMGHGFTKEHNAPRAHAYMLIDHLVVDRAYGGRFQPKDGWQYVVARPPFKTWDILKDEDPESNEHKAFIPESAAAANPTCLSCKTSSMILDWKYMGDPDPSARWARTSNVVEVARSLSDAFGCIHCHDPHATRPRIVRDALIDALTRPDAETLWHQDPKRTRIEVVEFRGFRKIALLEKYDPKLQCGQCHVEYNCNPGYNLKTGERIGFSDRRTNHFPFKDVFGIYDHYNALEFRDFKHPLTGGLLFKAQHPEVEVFWNSAHDRAGVTCSDCHMVSGGGTGASAPKSTTGKTATASKKSTSHWMTSPRANLKETCLRCHSYWMAEEAEYTIDSVKAHIRGKMRKAEFWLGQLIDKIVEARKAGITEDIIKQAQEQHQKAHIMWEWWTAENSDGFHNPEQARESLTKSVEEAKKGIDLLNAALTGK